MSPNITKSLDVAAFAVLHYTGTASAVVDWYLFHQLQHQPLSALRCVWQVRCATATSHVQATQLSLCMMQPWQMTSSSQAQQIIWLLG